MKVSDCSFFIIAKNKDENVHRFALGAIEGNFWREKERDSFGILYAGYLLSIVQIKREKEGDREKERQKCVTKKCDL